MAFVKDNGSFRRTDFFAFIADATTRPDSSKYSYNYITTDTAAVVEAAGYFDAETELMPGDVITAVMAMGGTPVLKQYVVTANNLAASGHITIALQTTAAG